MNTQTNQRYCRRYAGLVTAIVSLAFRVAPATAWSVAGSWIWLNRTWTVCADQVLFGLGRAKPGCKLQSECAADLQFAILRNDSFAPGELVVAKSSCFRTNPAVHLLGTIPAVVISTALYSAINQLKKLIIYENSNHIRQLETGFGSRLHHRRAGRCRLCQRPSVGQPGRVGPAG